MKFLDVLLSCLVGIGIVLILTMGVDLNNSRAGFGMVVLGLGGLFLGTKLIFGGSLPSKVSMIPIVILGGGYFGWRALSGGPPSLAMADITLVLIALCVYLIGVSGSEKVIRCVFLAWMFACIANVLVAGAQNSSDSFFYVWREVSGGEGRPTGLFGHYNPFASFLNASAFVLLSFTLRSRQKKWRISSGILLIALVVSLVASGSRGGGIAFIVGFFVWVSAMLLDLKASNSKRFGVALLGASAGAVVVVLLGAFLVNRINSTRAAEASERHGVEFQSGMDDGGRLAFQQMAFDTFQESPLTGSGPRAFSYKAYEHWDFDEHGPWNHDPEFAHNEFLQTLSDYGLLGFLILLAVFFTHISAGLMHLIMAGGEESQFIRTLQLGAFGGLAALVTQSFFSFLIHVPTCVVLMAFLLALLIRGREKRRAYRVFPVIVGGSLAAASICLAVIGFSLGHSFVLGHEAATALKSDLTPDRSIEVLNSLAMSAEKGWDSSILEDSGRVAMAFAADADKLRKAELAKKLRLVALNHFQRALQLNPHASIAISGLPQVYDALGEFEKAEAEHQVAMERIWIREYFLRPYYHAARSMFIRGVQACTDEEYAEGYRFLETSLKRLKQREELLTRYRESPEEQSVRLEATAWVSFIEGQRLYREGDRVWKKARPRNPELACALMLEAAEKYRASDKILRPVSSLWRAQWKQLQENLQLFETVKTKPALLTEKQLSDIINPEAGLDPGPATR